MAARRPVAEIAAHGRDPYTRTRWTPLTRYVDEGPIEIDSNEAERAIRAFVLGRRNHLAGSDAGGETAARLYSLIGTGRLNGLDPHLYLGYVLERTYQPDRDLLPWHVARSLKIPQRRAA